MEEQGDFLKYPNYLLSTYQLEIYKQLSLYMEKSKFKQKDVAAQLKVSVPYINQVLNGNFNFTLKKLIELALAIGKVPYLEFIEPDEYWRRERYGTIKETFHTILIDSKLPDEGGRLPIAMKSAKKFESYAVTK